LQRLDAQARQIERTTNAPPLGELVARENHCSSSYGGRSVFGWERPPAADA
jgi:hypothetical protein